MKTTIVTLLLLFSLVSIKAATNQPAASAPVNTNAILPTAVSPEAGQALATAVNALRSNVADLRGQVESFQKRMDRIETGFLVVVILFVITVVAVCFLSARNSAVKQRYDGRDDSKTVTSG